MTSEDGRSMKAHKGDTSSVKSDAFEVDDDDDDDMGISFTAAATASAREGKYCLAEKPLFVMYVRLARRVFTQSASRWSLTCRQEMLV